MKCAMTEQPAKMASPKGQRTIAQIRAERQKAALKANMARRKAQAKSRAEKDNASGA
jgi:hypothetical protein